MTTFTVQVKDSDKLAGLETTEPANDNDLTVEIAIALKQVKQIQSGEIESLSLKDI